MEITGRIVRILEEKSGTSKSTGKRWVTQEYILETIEARPRKICFGVLGEERIKSMNIQMGESLVVSIEIEAREYQGRWFTEVRAWKVERPLLYDATSSTSQMVQEQPLFSPMSELKPLPPNEIIDLPF